MTQPEIAALEVLEKAATPGEWWVERDTALIWGEGDPDDYSSYGMGYPVAEAVTQKAHWNKRKDEPSYERSVANAAFIAALRNAAPALIAKAKEVGELKANLSEARFRLGAYADASEISGMSWDGFNVIGDKKSILEIQRIENRSSQLEIYQRAFDNRIASLRSLLAKAGEALERSTGDIFAKLLAEIKALQEK